MAQSTTKVQGEFYPLQHKEWLRLHFKLMQSSFFEITFTFEVVEGGDV
ncbi:MAG: hypothetical protein QNJ63_21710 [Calothrix sp. MO_192.B10]|nr:hypothetical protein [Calothrix sp. MO_192.B10]